jgi:hypothetical protein
MADKPFPSTEAEIDLFLKNRVVKMPIYQAALGVTAAEVTKLNDGAQNFEYLMNLANQISDTKEAFTNFKNTMYYGEQAAQPAIPIFPIVAMPNTGQQGIVTFAKALIKRIKTSSGYTEQIGEDLGLIVVGGDSLSPAEIVPELKLRAIEDGVVEIKFSKDGLDAMKIDWKPKGEETWQLAGVYTSSPALHNGSNGGNPQAREYRGRLLKKNEPVSQYSAIYSVVTTP